MDGLEQPPLGEACQREAGLVKRLGPLGGGADAHGRERAADAREEAGLLGQGAGVGDHGESVHLQAVVVAEAHGLVQAHTQVELKSVASRRLRDRRWQEYRIGMSYFSESASIAGFPGEEAGCSRRQRRTRWPTWTSPPSAAGGYARTASRSARPRDKAPDADRAGVPRCGVDDMPGVAVMADARAQRGLADPSVHGHDGRSERVLRRSPASTPKPEKISDKTRKKCAFYYERKA